MVPSQHAPADRFEQINVSLLVREKRVDEEVGQDDLSNVAQTPRFPLDRLIASVRSDRPASEMLGHELDHLASVSVLADGDARSHLPPDPDSRARANRHGEASFTIEVAGDV